MTGISTLSVLRLGVGILIVKTPQKRLHRFHEGEMHFSFFCQLGLRPGLLFLTVNLEEVCATEIMAKKYLMPKRK
jgi:hypothetical protein